MKNLIKLSDFLNEAMGEGNTNSMGPKTGKWIEYTKLKPFTLSNLVFANQEATINTNSPEFKKIILEMIGLISEILPFKKSGYQGPTPLKIMVSGGASSVGLGTKFWDKEKNDALANSRANNFIDAIKKAVPTVIGNIEFVLAPPTIGPSKIKDSDMAIKEQNIKLWGELEKEAYIYDYTERDNTAVAIPDKRGMSDLLKKTKKDWTEQDWTEQEGDDKKYKRICVRVKLAEVSSFEAKLKGKYWYSVSDYPKGWFKKNQSTNRYINQKK